MRTNITLDVDTVRRVLERDKAELDARGTTGHDYGDQQDRVVIEHALLKADLEVACKRLEAFYREYDHLRPDVEVACELCGRNGED